MSMTHGDFDVVEGDAAVDRTGVSGGPDGAATAGRTIGAGAPPTPASGTGAEGADAGRDGATSKRVPDSGGGRSGAAAPLTRRDLWQVLILGLLGYYLSSFLDFLGLLYISATLIL